MPEPLNVGIELDPIKTNQKHENHMIPKLLLTSLLGLVASVAVCADKDKTAATEKDIIATAQSAGTFKTLLTALNAADKTAMLQDKGPYTVFAPSDDAFSKLPEGTVEDLLKPENKEKLGKLLAYHVIEGKIMAADLTSMMAKTANGAELDIKVTSDAVTVNKAKVTTADVKASNGVIHVIDTVLMPPAE